MEIKRTEQKVRKTPTMLKQEIEQLQLQIDVLLESVYCHMCDKHLSKSAFYVSTNPRIKSGVTPICKQCATRIACNADAQGNLREPTKASVMTALEYLDKPFLNTVWDAAYFELHGSNKGKKKNIWSTYIKNIQLKNYDGMRWRDSDIFKGGGTAIQYLDSALPSSEEENLTDIKKKQELEIKEEYFKNRKDVIKKVGYDPLQHYPKEEDKQYLYASLNNMIDEDAQDDGMKIRAIIEIVQVHNQIDKINEAMNAIITAPEKILDNAPQIEKFQKIKKGLSDTANSLAKDNGISVNFNNNKSKGANTLSGKIKELAEHNFEGADINTFDIATCKGMLQVAELSEKARHAQIGYDENIAQEIKDIKITLIEELTKERDAALESLRILLDENLKLKAYLKDRGFIDDSGKVLV